MIVHIPTPQYPPPLSHKNSDVNRTRRPERVVVAGESITVEGLMAADEEDADLKTQAYRQWQQAYASGNSQWASRVELTVPR